jgi:ABC-type Co2+ transport system permease subunit
MDSMVSDIITRMIKYLVEGLAVAVAAVIIPKRKLDMPEIASLAVLAAVVFAVLDFLAPTVGVTARQGAGFGIGAKLVGFP